MQVVQVSVDIPPGTKALTLKTRSAGPHPGYSAWVNAGFVKQPTASPRECRPVGFRRRARLGRIIGKN